MAKVDLLKDFLVKINNVFSNDIYIIRNRIVVGGISSYAKANGRYVCLLNENIKQELDSILGINAITKISSIEDAKKDFTKNISIVDDIHQFNDKEQEEIQTNLDVYDDVNKVETWFSLEEKLSLNDIESIIDKGDMIELFNDNEKPILNIGKSLLPFMAKKTLTDFFYSDMINTGNGIWKIFFKINHVHFITYLCFWILE